MVETPGELAQEEVEESGSQQTRPRASREIRTRVAGAVGQGPQGAGSRPDRTGRDRMGRRGGGGEPRKREPQRRP